MPINFDTPTPQLKVTRTLLESYMTRDLSKVEPLLSKDFKYRSFPEVDHHPEETKEEHMENWGPRFSSFSKVDIFVHEVIEAQGKVVTHLTSAWTTPDGSTHHYDSVCTFYFVLENGQLKVSGIKDFADADKRSAYHDAAAKVVGENAGLVT